MNLKSLPVLRFAGFGLVLTGTLLNISMFVRNAWPTYLFFLLMAVGVVFIIISYRFRTLSSFGQVVILVLIFLLMFMLRLW